MVVRYIHTSMQLASQCEEGRKHPLETDFINIVGEALTTIDQRYYPRKICRDDIQIDFHAYNRLASRVPDLCLEISCGLSRNDSDNKKQFLKECLEKFRELSKGPLNLKGLVIVVEHHDTSGAYCGVGQMDGGDVTYF